MKSRGWLWLYCVWVWNLKRESLLGAVNIFTILCPPTHTHRRWEREFNLLCIYYYMYVPTHNKSINVFYIQHMSSNFTTPLTYFVCVCVVAEQKNCGTRWTTRSNITRKTCHVSLLCSSQKLICFQNKQTPLEIHIQF